jgi:hypothetical protein
MGKPNENFLTETGPARLSKHLLHTCMSDDLQHGKEGCLIESIFPFIRESFQQKTETRDRQVVYRLYTRTYTHGVPPSNTLHD